MAVVDGCDLGHDEDVIHVSVKPIQECGSIHGLDVGVACVERLLHARVCGRVPVQVGADRDSVGWGVVCEPEEDVLGSALSRGCQDVTGLRVTGAVVSKRPADRSHEEIFQADEEIRGV